ncbi:MAG: hypothetical protein AB9869_11440 [Verrucomicrobiia bacterium]
MENKILVLLALCAAVFLAARLTHRHRETGGRSHLRPDFASARSDGTVPGGVSFRRPALSRPYGVATPLSAISAVSQWVDFRLLAERYWDTNALSQADVERGDALDAPCDPDARFSYLPSSEMRWMVMDALVQKAKSIHAIQTTALLSDEEKEDMLEAVNQQFEDRLALVLGEWRSDFDRRESDEAFTLREYQALGLGLSQAQFDAILDVEIKAGRAANSPGADVGAIEVWKECEIAQIDAAVAERFAMIDDSTFRTLNQVGARAGLGSAQIASLWRVNQAYISDSQSVYADEFVTDDERERQLSMIRQARIAEADELVPAPALAALLQDTDTPLAFLIGDQAPTP